MFLELIKKIAIKEEKDVINTARRAKALEKVSEYEYLTVFVKFEQSQKLAEQDDLEESEMDKMRSIIASNGSNISNPKRWEQSRISLDHVEVLYQSTADQLAEGLLDDC